MCKLLYALKDYFDALAQARSGWFSGFINRSVSNVFAVFGDLCRAKAGLSLL